MTKDVNAALSALKKSKFRSRFKLTEKERQYINCQRCYETVYS